MSLPSAFTAAGSYRHLWIEVEGWPWAFGSFAASSTFFSARAAVNQFLGVKASLRGEGDGRVRFPDLSPTTMDWLGGRASIATMRIPFVDKDGLLQTYCAGMRRDGWGELSTDIIGTSAGTTVGYTDGSGWAADSAIWCGREAMTYAGAASSPLTVVRGAYRSAITPHKGYEHFDGAVGHTAVEHGWPGNGAVLTPYPQHILGQRCWVRYWAGTTGGPPSDATGDSESITVFAGEIRGYSWEDSGQTLVLDLEDSGSILRRPVGKRWFASRNSHRHPDIAGWKADEGPLKVEIGNAPWSATATAEHSGFWRFESRILLAVPDTSGVELFEKFRFAGHGFVELDSATSIKGIENIGPIFLVSDRIKYTSLWAGYYCDFVPTIKPDGIRANHPLLVLLHFLVSTGTRTVAAPWTITEGTNGNYDTLPGDWGLGIPDASTTADGSGVDVAGIVALAQRNPGHAVSMVLTEPIKDFREWAAENLLKPFGYALRFACNGILQVKQCGDPTPDDLADAVTLSDTSANILHDPESKRLLIGPWRCDTSGMIAGFTWIDGPAFLAGSTDGKIEWLPPLPFVVKEDAFVQARLTLGDTVEIKSSGTHLYADPERRHGWTVHAPDLPADTMSRLWSRYGSPRLTLEVQAPLSLLEVEPGDWMELTCANMPSPYAATRGLSEVLCEVVSKKMDLNANRIMFTLGFSFATQARSRYIAPSGIVTVYSAGPPVTVTIGANNFSDSAGDFDDRHGFLAGYYVRVYTSNFVTRSDPVQIDSIAGNVLTMVSDAWGGHTPAATDIVTLADYPDGGVGQRARFAYRAGNDELLDTSTDPHELA